MVTYGKLRDTIAAFMHRPSDVFIYNGVDMLLQAVNNAKNFAQRAVDFELSKKFGQLTNVSWQNGAEIDSLVEFGTNNLLTVKSIKAAFLDSTAQPPQQYPVPFSSREAYVMRLRRRFSEVVTPQDARSTPFVFTDIQTGVIQIGNKIYIVPVPTNVSAPTNIYFDVVQWIDDFTTRDLAGVTTSTTTLALMATAGNFVSLGVRVGDVVLNTATGASAIVVGVNSATRLDISSDIFSASNQGYLIKSVDPTQTNFLLDFCFDYMVYRSIYELNFFLKEDSRVQLSTELMTSVWNNMLAWNGTIIGNTVDDPSLD